MSNSDLLELAIAVAVTKQSDLGGFGDDSLDLNTHFVFAPRFFLYYYRLGKHLVIKSFLWQIRMTSHADSKLRHYCQLF